MRDPAERRGAVSMSLVFDSSLTDGILRQVDGRLKIAR